MTRVLMTADTVGGVWTYALELADALAAAGVEVHLGTVGPLPTGAQQRDAARSSLAGLHQIEAALEWMPDPWKDVERSGRRLLELETSIHPDVVHLNSYAHAALPWRAPVVVVAHSDVWSWWRAVHGEEPPASWQRYRAAVTAGLDAAAAVVAPTRAAAACLTRSYGPRDVRIVPNGRSDSWVRPAVKEPLVLGAGRMWDEAKNLRMLVAAAPHFPWPVVVAGDAGPAAPTLPPQVRALGRLSFEELAGWMLKASIFVSPACYEPFGLAALEAAIAGCALVLGDIDSHREVWGDAADYVSRDDAEGLVATVRSISADPARLRGRGERARERATRYRPDVMAASYRELYTTVLEQVGAAPCAS